MEYTSPVNTPLSPSARGLASGALRDYLSLTKPRLSSLVIFTVAGGLWMSGAQLEPVRWLLTMFGTAGIVGAANAFNCVIERDLDGLMSRTANRPLPRGRLAPSHALIFAFALAAVSFPLLFIGSNMLTGALGVLALLCYVLAYTPLKRRTHLAMQVGGVSGALPPLMGFTAGAGHIAAPGVVLAAILYFWQMPHFIAIALFRKAEYRAAGFHSLPLAEGDATARRHALVYTVLLILSSLAPVPIGMGSVWYGVAAFILGAGLLSFVVAQRPDWARRLFVATLFYLGALFVALTIDHIL